jgi:hypothetical protein
MKSEFNESREDHVDREVRKLILEEEEGERNRPAMIQMLAMLRDSAAFEHDV